MLEAKKWWRTYAMYGTGATRSGVSRRPIIVNQIGMTFGLVALFYSVVWFLKGGLGMVGLNLLLALILLAIPWLNSKGFINFTRFFFMFSASTFVFVFVGMIGKTAQLHTSFYTIIAFSLLLFDPKEKWKMGLAFLYPTTLFVILAYNDFNLFPDLLGGPLTEFENYNYAINIFFISFSTYYLFRVSEKAEDRYKELYEQLIQSQKLVDEGRSRAIHSMRMASLGEMAGGIAHEINSPLNVITLLANKIDTRIPRKAMEEAELLSDVSKISKTDHRISSIVNSLRSISRTGEGLPMKDEEVGGILQETLALCSERFSDRKIDFRLEVADDLPHLRCRRVEISQVLLNLLNNAFDAVEQVKYPTIFITARRNVSTLEISVTDNGPGIPLELQEKIFQPFFTTKDVGKGTGLGLSVSHSLIEANNGRLFVISKPNETSFVIQLRL